LVNVVARHTELQEQSKDFQGNDSNTEIFRPKSGEAQLYCGRMF